jgi:hypothetical protein
MGSGNFSDGCELKVATGAYALTQPFLVFFGFPSLLKRPYPTRVISAANQSKEIRLRVQAPFHCSIGKFSD